MPNTPDPTETFGPTRSKAVTEEDVRVSTWVDAKLLELPEVKDLDKDNALLALRLVAAFEQVRDPILYLGTAGSVNISTSELRWGVALSLVNVLNQANNGLRKNRDEEQKRIDEDVKNAAKDDDNEPAETPEGADLTTTPSALLDKFASDAGLNLERKDDTVTAPGKTAEAESASRVENKSPASGTPHKDEVAPPSQARATDKK